MDRKTRDAFWRQSALDGLHLFRLKPGGKRPISDHTKWSGKAFDSVAEVEAAIKDGNNLALRPHSTAEWRLIVIDCDVKPAKVDGAMSRGIVSLHRVGDAIGEDLEKWEPRVGTGPGYECIVDEDETFGDDIERRRGLHILMWVPADFQPLKRNYAGLPGIEFIDGPKGYVVFAGSRIKAAADGEYRPAHECSYDLDKETLEAVKAGWFSLNDAPMLGDEALTGLSELLAQADTSRPVSEKPEPADNEPVGKPTASTFGVATDNELQEILDHLPSENYADNESWQPICFAAHHATGGRESALEIFLEWCTRLAGFDTEENEADVRKRWLSLKEKNGEVVLNARTLLREAKIPGGFKFAAEKQWEKKEGLHKENDHRPVIEVRGDNRNEVIREVAFEIFKRRGQSSIFRRGPELVEVARAGEALDDKFEETTDEEGKRCFTCEGVRYYPGTAFVYPMSEDSLLYEADETVRFAKFDGKKNGFKACNAPSYLGKLHKQAKLLKFVELKALRLAPGIDFKTGEILNTPSSTVQRGFMSIFDPEEFAGIRNDLTQEEAIAKLEWVHETLYKYFPFDDGEKGVSSAVNMSSAICAVLRSLMRGGAPGHVFDAPQASSGKTKLSITHGILATGTEPALATWSNNRVENGKQLSSMVRRGPPVIIYDNMDGEAGDVIKFPHVNTTITQDRVRLRVLGFSQDEELPTGVHLVWNGNYVQVQSDIVTRLVWCRLDTGMADPSSRKFEFDPVVRAAEMRGKLVAALLSAVASYIKAGRPLEDNVVNMRFGSDWRAIQGTLLWCGWKDPGESLEAVKASDESLADQYEAIEAWERLFESQDGWTTAEELWRIRQEETDAINSDRAADAGLIIDALAPGATDARTLSRKLGNGKKVVAGHTIKRTEGRVKKFKLEKRK